MLYAFYFFIIIVCTSMFAGDTQDIDSLCRFSLCQAGGYDGDLIFFAFDKQSDELLGKLKYYDFRAGASAWRGYSDAYFFVKTELDPLLKEMLEKILVQTFLGYIQQRQTDNRLFCQMIEIPQLLGSDSRSLIELFIASENKIAIVLDFSRLTLIQQKQSKISQLGVKIDQPDASLGVEEIMAEGVSINETGTCEKTLLYHAVASQKTDIVKVLIAHKADVNFPVNAGRLDYPLEVAVAQKNVGMCRILLEAQADVSLTRESGIPVLLKAAGNGGEDVVALLLEHNASVNDLSPLGEGVLSFACKARDVDLARKKEIITRLLAARADPNKRIGRASLPLHVMAGWPAAESIVEKLLDSNASVNEKDSQGKLPLLIALKSRQLNVSRLLLEQEGIDVTDSSGTNSFLIAALSGGFARADTADQDYALITTLVQKGVDINAHGKGQHSPLLMLLAACSAPDATCTKKALDCVRMLLGQPNIVIGEKEFTFALTSTAIPQDVVELMIDCLAQVNKLEDVFVKVSPYSVKEERFLVAVNKMVAVFFNQKKSLRPETIVKLSRFLESDFHIAQMLHNSNITLTSLIKNHRKPEFYVLKKESQILKLIIEQDDIVCFDDISLDILANFVAEMEWLLMASSNSIYKKLFEKLCASVLFSGLGEIGDFLFKKWLNISSSLDEVHDSAFFTAVAQQVQASKSLNIESYVLLLNEVIKKVHRIKDRENQSALAGELIDLLSIYERETSDIDGVKKLARMVSEFPDIETFLPELTSQGREVYNKHCLQQQ